MSDQPQLLAPSLKSSVRRFSEMSPELYGLFRRYSNAYFTAAADEHREGASDSSIKKHDDAYRAAEDAFLTALVEKLEGNCAALLVRAERAEAEVKRLHHELVSGGHNQRRDFVAESNLLLAGKNASIKRLREALERIVADADSDNGATAHDGADIARAALKGTHE